MKSLPHQFLDWCRSKPADETYEYTDASGCAFYQFAVATGIPDPVRHATPDYGSPSIPAALYGPIHGYPRTFGALADRLAESVSA